MSTVKKFEKQPVIPEPPNTRTDTKAVFLQKADTFNSALKAWADSFNASVVDNLNALVDVLNAQLPYIDTVADADAAIRAVYTAIAQVNTVSAGIESVNTCATWMEKIKLVAENMAEVVSAQGYAEEAKKWALMAEAVVNVKPATKEALGLVIVGDGLDVDSNGIVSVEKQVFVLGYPVVTMAQQIATGMVANVTLSAPAVLLPGATVSQYHVSVDGGEVQDVTAVNNVGAFSFTPTGAAGSTATLKVTATDSVGNVSLTTTATAQVVDSYVVAPTIISPAAGASLYSTPIPVVTSAFSVFGTEDTHASTDWKITSDEAGNTVVSEALASSDLLAHSFPAISVTQVEQRHLWARHNGQNIGPSEWGHIVVSVNPSRHGEILYDTSNNPAAVITGSYLSGGKEPWCIRGRYVWLAFALASKHGVDKTWNLSSSDSNYVDITTIENPGTSWKLAANNTAADGSDSYVSTLSTEAHMDASFTYAQAVKNSKELTDAILAYNASYMAAQFCRSVTLKDLGAMDLPSIDVLMRLYQARNVVDALDSTASANSAKKLSGWGFGSAGGSGVWSASEYNSSRAWYVRSDGHLNGNNKNGRFGCVPSLEIPA